MIQSVMKRFTAALLPWRFKNRIPGHTTKEPPVGFELATKGIQFYVIANLDMTSLRQSILYDVLLCL